MPGAAIPGLNSYQIEQLFSNPEAPPTHPRFTPEIRLLCDNLGRTLVVCNILASPLSGCLSR
jgi:hypothetical protein